MPALFAVLLSIPEKPRTIDWGKLLRQPAAERLLAVHSFEGVRWFRKESLEMLAACAALLRRMKTKKILDAAQAPRVTVGRLSHVPVRHLSRSALIRGLSTSMRTGKSWGVSQTSSPSSCIGMLPS